MLKVHVFLRLLIQIIVEVIHTKIYQIISGMFGKSSFFNRSPLEALNIITNSVPILKLVQLILRSTSMQK